MRQQTWQVWTGVTLAALLSGCGNSQILPAEAIGVSPVAAKEVYHFEDLATMLATSDLVISGHVISTAPGPKLADHEPSGQAALATIAVDETFLGSSAATIVLQQAGHDSTGRRYIVNGLNQADVGDRGFFFLMSPRGLMTGYAVINSQGLYIESGGRHRGSNPEDQLVQELDRLSPPELRAQIMESARRVQSGTVQRAEPGGLAAPER